MKDKIEVIVDVLNFIADSDMSVSVGDELIKICTWHLLDIISDDES
jgi:hypothetical protein